MSVLKIAGVQLDIAWENREANYKKVKKFAQRAKKQNVDVLVLPEMFATGFSLNTEITAEDANGETPHFIKNLAKELNLFVIGGYVQKRRNNTGTNLALAVGPDGVGQAEYGKVHLFSHSGEDKIHQAGAGPRPFKIQDIEASCFICYDLRFPGLFSQVADTAELIFVIASWPAQRQNHWDILLPARAVENQLYVVGINRVGSGGGLDYTGGSVIIDPLGNTIAKGGNKEGLVIAEIDNENVKTTRKKLPFLKDRKF